MAEEFVDLYQVLELPVDADRSTVRKRVNEMYLDAQRNLDHRNFATRVKFQELFEVTLPQARYILLDDGRRHEYDRIVHAFRAAKEGGPPAPADSASAPVSSPKEAPPSSFSLERSEPAVAEERAPTIEPLPQAEVDPAQLAQEREELWKKWKNGLEAALTVEGDKPKSRAATTSTPTSFSTVAAPEAEPASKPAPTAPVSSAPSASASVQVASVQGASVQGAPIQSAPPVAAAPKEVARPKVAISFNSDSNEDDEPQSAVAGAAIFDDDAEQKISAAEIEQRRTEHRRQLIKEVLVNVGLIWGIIGAAMVLVPGLIGLIAAAGHYYPRGAKALLGFPPQAFWSIGFLIVGVAAFFASRALSKNMRRKKATELSFLAYEDLLKQIGKS